MGKDRLAAFSDGVIAILILGRIYLRAVSSGSTT
jgi:hypothetical protein